MDTRPRPEANFYIETLLWLAAGRYIFQRLHYEFETEEDALKFMEDARKVGWTWPDWAIVCRKSS